MLHQVHRHSLWGQTAARKVSLYFLTKNGLNIGRPHQGLALTGSINIELYAWLTPSLDITLKTSRYIKYKSILARIHTAIDFGTTNEARGQKIRLVQGIKQTMRKL